MAKKKTTTTKQQKPAAAPTPAASAKGDAPPERVNDLGLPNSHQSVWARAARIHALILQGRRFTTADLMAELETDERTVRRAIEFMRRLNAPLEFCTDRQTFYYTRKWDFLPSMLVTKKERLAVQLFQLIFPQAVEPTFGPSVHSVVQKVKAVAGDDALDDSLREVGLPKALLGAGELKHLPTIHDAIVRCQELRISYLKDGATEPAVHVLQPHRLRFFDCWSLFAHDLSRNGEQRTFVLARVQSAEILPTTFTRPPNFDPDKILEGNIGAYTGNEDHLVRVTLRRGAIQKAELNPWHPSQQLVRRSKGVAEITLRLNNLVEVKRKILACGQNAEVLEPAALRAAVRQSLLMAAALYEEE